MTSLLIIEDDEAQLFILRRMLRGRYDFTEVRTLSEGLALLNEYNYDAVLLDPGLPDSRREITVARIKAAKSSPLILVLSGNEDPTLRAKALRDSASNYLIKGIDDKDPNTLSAAIDLGIATHRNVNGLDRARQEIDSDPMI